MFRRVSRRVRYVPLLVVTLAAAACTGDDAADGGSSTSDSTSTSASPSSSSTPSSTSPTSATPGAETSTSETESPPSAAASDIDSCLLGRWEQTSMTSQRELSGELVESEGWTGRVLEFQPDGTEIVTYDDASPITAEGPDGQFSEQWRGVALYEVSTSGDTLTFDSVDFSGTSVVWQYGDQNGEGQLGNSSPVTYTCDDTTHTQRTATYDAEFTRLP